MFNPKKSIQIKIAEREQKKIDERIVCAADKMPAAEINNLMTALGLPQFANFK